MTRTREKERARLDLHCLDAAMQASLLNISREALLLKVGEAWDLAQKQLQIWREYAKN